jgi:hypothetical protein
VVCLLRESRIVGPRGMHLETHSEEPVTPNVSSTLGRVPQAGCWGSCLVVSHHKTCQQSQLLTRAANVCFAVLCMQACLTRSRMTRVRAPCCGLHCARSSVRPACGCLTHKRWEDKPLD